MVKRYSFFRQHKNIKELDDYITSPSSRSYFEEALDYFKNFEGFSICLQGEGLLLTTTHFILNHVCDGYRTMSEYFADDARIVYGRPFEDARVKIMSGRQNQLRTQQQTLLSGLCIVQNE